jgi:hypothetical protein
LKRRNRIVAGTASAVTIVALAAVSADAGVGALTVELDAGIAKRGEALALTVDGSASSDAVKVATSAGDIVVSVTAPDTIDGPDECTQNTPQQFTCDSSLGIDGVIGVMGRGGDLFDAKELSLVTNQYGGRGNDRLLGGTKFDLLNGGRGNNDVCKGFHGPETIKKCE